MDFKCLYIKGIRENAVPKVFTTTAADTAEFYTKFKEHEPGFAEPVELDNVESPEYYNRYLPEGEVRIIALAIT